MSTAPNVASVREQAAQWCAAQPGAWLDYPFDEATPVYKLRARPDAPAKMFALISDHRLNLKADPEISLGLREAHAFIEPAWHMSKRHWNTVRLDLVAALDPDDAAPALALIVQLIEDSWDLVVEGLPRADRDRLRTQRVAEVAEFRSE
ncbi:MAG: MmcQ/YjbR family DNA-binding protein [Micrococcus sp.]|nr:MmcQ/YjbR family DNA-binding protein [Micrococcus sp.]